MTRSRLSAASPALLPLGALLLATSHGALAQSAAGAPSPAPAPTAAAAASAPTPGPAASTAKETTASGTLSTVVVKDKAMALEGKDTLRVMTSRIGRGEQAIRDIPQSLTVVTEKLIDDRNLDTIKEVLKNTAGVTFMAGETGEEDIRLRGFSLAGTGDIFLDGMRDPAFYDRDTFNQDRVEVLRGSASMLFGRGSTGGAVNQVSKVPRLMDENEVTTTVGSHAYRRVTADLNKVVGQDAALRVNAMRTLADNNGSGTSLDKEGLAAALRWGIGTRDECLVNAYWLKNDNGINYGIPWIKPTSSSPSSSNTILPGLKPTDYFGMASDYNHGSAKFLAASHVHRFDGEGELRTQLRQGNFTRDQRASAIRFVSTSTSLANFGPSTALRRETKLKIQDVDTLQVQADYSTKVQALGASHRLQLGMDAARERKEAFTPYTVAQGGAEPTKPNTTIGAPDDGAWIDEASRRLRTSNRFEVMSVGAYAQDLAQITPAWKLLGGVRFDSMRGRYDQYNLSATSVASTDTYRQNIAEWSHRVGTLYQPNEVTSVHLSWGTSFNTSGDTYSYNALSANTPPESSRNLELGARLDSQDRRFSTRLALFRSEKLHERNTDSSSAATQYLLSGKRHASGLEVEVSGRPMPRWEVFSSYMWMPIAVVDVAAPTSTSAGNRQGDRPGLSPRHSGTVWSTYQVTAAWRLGGGVNFRSKQAPADASNPVWEAAGFATADLMAEYRINDQFQIKTNLNNLSNRYYADALYRGHYVPGTGRMLQVALISRF